MSNNLTHYVKQLNINGVNVVQVPCIELQGVPNAATVGAVGLLGMDVTSGSNDVYLCTAVNGAIYTWMPLKDGKDGVGVIKSVVNYNGELELTLSNGTILNAGKVVGEHGANVTNIKMNDNYELIFTLSDTNVINAGIVNSITNVAMNDNGELEVMFANGTVTNAGKVLPKMQDLLGTEPIGKYGHLYYNGETFVERPPSLEEASWWQIIELADAGRAEEYFSVGDEKTVELVTGEKVTFVILGFNYDDLADDSGKANITFGMKDLLSTKYPMLSSDTAVGYSASQMHTKTLPNVYSQLPTDLRSGIKSVRKLAPNVYNEQENVVCQLFLFTGAETSKNSGAYAYYRSENSSWNKLLGGTGNSSSWWLRQIQTSVSPNWGTRSAEYSLAHGIGTQSAGVCFGFCI